MTVAIIIPVYNVSDYIENCMMSVMNQTYDDMECIIVDDATQDDSIDKCYRMIQVYQGPIKFSILHHGKNRGLSAARNTGAEAATGVHYNVGREVRNAIEKIGGTMPEDLPTPEKSIQQIEKEQMERLRAKAKAGQIQVPAPRSLRQRQTSL